MRNETVERIVNLLFQDVEMTDDAGMNNIDVHSRSGDISMRRSGRMGSRTVTGSIRSVSGDIEIH